MVSLSSTRVHGWEMAPNATGNGFIGLRRAARGIGDLPDLRADARSEWWCHIVILGKIEGPVSELIVMIIYLFSLLNMLNGGKLPGKKVGKGHLCLYNITNGNTIRNHSQVSPCGKIQKVRFIWLWSPSSRRVSFHLGQNLHLPSTPLCLTTAEARPPQ